VLGDAIRLPDGDSQVPDGAGRTISTPSCGYRRRNYLSVTYLHMLAVFSGSRRPRNCSTLGATAVVSRQRQGTYANLQTDASNLFTSMSYLQTPSPDSYLESDKYRHSLVRHKHYAMFQTQLRSLRITFQQYFFLQIMQKFISKSEQRKHKLHNNLLNFLTLLLQIHTYFPNQSIKPMRKIAIMNSILGINCISYKNATE